MHTIKKCYHIINKYVIIQQVINVLLSINTLTCHFTGLKKKSNLAVEADLLEKQQEKEKEHEMHMQGMILSFMQQMMSTITGRGYDSPSGMTSHLPHGSCPTSNAYHPHTSLSNE